MQTLDLPLLSFHTIMTEPLPAAEWILAPLIGRGDRSVWYGESGSFKTFVSLHMALHLASQQRWLGKFAIPEALPVFYIDCEMNPHVLRSRLVRLVKGAQISAEDLPLRALSNYPITFDKDGAEQLLWGLDRAKFDPKVIIVETLRRVLLGDERSAQDVAAFWDNLEPLRKEERTIILTHHMRKFAFNGNNTPKDRASGSTDIIAGADSSVAFSRKGQMVTLEQVKNRQAVEYPPFSVEVIDQDPYNPDSPIILQYAGDKPDRSSRTKETHDALDAFVSQVPEQTIKTETAMKFLEEDLNLHHGTAEKEWTKYRENYCENVGYALYRRKRQQPEVLQSSESSHI